MTCVCGLNPDTFENCEAVQVLVAPGVDLSEAGGNAEVALGASLTWEWDIQIGDEKRTLQMKMVRAHY